MRIRRGIWPSESGPGWVTRARCWKLPSPSGGRWWRAPGPRWGEIDSLFRGLYVLPPPPTDCRTVGTLLKDDGTTSMIGGAETARDSNPGPITSPLPSKTARLHSPARTSRAPCVCQLRVAVASMDTSSPTHFAALGCAIPMARSSAWWPVDYAAAADIGAMRNWRESSLTA